ncbi:hypothetical protein ASAC_1498 [Acidilobus saccharovorans 345-15]|uniref:Uncharacterized protein n=1 Tax=Acidilobus saccharovorans (strain DSM 16705 / JCM 18335 / VKM B-2471 / 345-15) TaxID=666510 RepID=D9PZB6_ACIS3|nr:hypothetical protein ASAC_1498 [Acidilobus saccharovorans 345-15]
MRAQEAELSRGERLARPSAPGPLSAGRAAEHVDQASSLRS